MLSRRQLLELGVPAVVAAALPVPKAWPSSDGITAPKSPATTPFRASLPIPRPDPPITISPDELIARLRAQPNPVPQRELTDDFVNFIRGEVSDEIDLYDYDMREAPVEIIPGLSTTIWGYDGRFPGPFIRASAGGTTVIRFTNSLPAFAGTGEGTVIHLHGGHMPPEWDGFAAEFMPYGTSRYYIYPNRQRAGTLWFHDHAMDITGPDVYRGLAGFYTITDDFERGLQQARVLPDDAYDMPLVIQDRIFQADGSLFYDSFSHDGFLGDTFLVNGAVQPACRVEPRRYRFRLLNGSNARYYEVEFNNGLPFVQVGIEAGGLLPASVERRSIRMAMAERHDVIVDFSKLAGKSVVLNNILQQTDGRGPGGVDRSNPTPLVRFDVTLPLSGIADSLPIANATALRPVDPPVGPVAATRTFRFVRTNGAWAINGRFFDPARSDANVRLNDIEEWTLVNGSGGWQHPIHIHDVTFQVLDRNGAPPPPWEAGWRDMVNLGKNETARVRLRFDDYVGKYHFHCHNVEHEDMRMMGRFDVLP
jgi:spore coat protein A, manganese oxidase